jgi:hypothetical protein
VAWLFTRLVFHGGGHLSDSLQSLDSLAEGSVQSVFDKITNNSSVSTKEVLPAGCNEERSCNNASSRYFVPSMITFGTTGDGSESSLRANVCLGEFKRARGANGDYFPRLSKTEKRKLVLESSHQVSHVDLVGLLCDLLADGRPGTEEIMIDKNAQTKLASSIARALGLYGAKVLIEAFDLLPVVPENVYGVCANTRKRMCAAAAVREHKERKTAKPALSSEAMAELMGAIG